MAVQRAAHSQFHLDDDVIAIAILRFECNSIASLSMEPGRGSSLLAAAPFTSSIKFLDSSDNNDDFQTMMMMMPIGHDSHRSLSSSSSFRVLISFYEFTFRELDHKSVARTAERKLISTNETDGSQRANKFTWQVKNHRHTSLRQHQPEVNWILSRRGPENPFAQLRLASRPNTFQAFLLR